ncbi:hypothetical protein ABZ725_12655 [Streptomyces sp. NPDC006872]|uniref:hypothetical protein n=1 Tax=Streptomyces sp. NPDC006872 TaxID=3155720 RepID=UPI0033F16F36
MTRRRHHARETTRNTDAFRATATWPHNGPPAICQNSDGPRVRRRAAEWADQGAYVVVEHHRRGRWRLVDTLDGPALRRAAAEQEAAEQRDRVESQLVEETAAFCELVLDEHTEDEQHRLARLMAAPPAPREVRARHTAGGLRR